MVARADVAAPAPGAPAVARRSALGRRRGRRPSRLRRPLQVEAFVRKELSDVVHQPRLLVTLVVGPFLILLAFGLGYRERNDPFEAWFAAAPGSPVLEQIEQHQDQFSRYVRISGSGDQAAGLDALRDGRVDVVVVLPDDPLAEVRQGRQAQVVVLHDRIDPLERTAIIFAARLAVDQMNAAVVAGVIGEGQERAEPWQAVLDRSRAAVAALDGAVASADPGAVAAARRDLRAAMGDVDRALRATASLTDGLRSEQGQAERTSLLGQLDDAAALADGVETTLGEGNDEATRDQVRQLGNVLDGVDRTFVQLVGTDPTVLAQPFATDVESVAPVKRNLTDFYAPAAIILIVQQFGVAFGALSFVRESQLGIVELYRAGPIGATEALLGKYLAYLAVGGAVATALTAAVTSLLGVPMAGSVGGFAVVIALTLVASIGLGLLISLVSASDTQAVQYTLIALLASLFFSAFFLTLDQLAYPAKVVSWLLPATYGISLLRDNMLRGAALDRMELAGLAAYAAVAFLVVLFGARRRLAVER
jgi:ABC-2 type transport system permease protein